MRFTGLQCTADLVGLRVCARWGFELEGSESISDIPDVLLRKKLFDYEFPPLVPGDPYIVYDSAAFPPAPVPGSLAVVDLPTKEWVEGDMRITRSTVSVAAVSGPDRQEILRETRERRFDALGHLTSVSVEVIDAADLTEGQTLYFELDDGSAPDPDQRKAYTDTAVPGAIHGHNSHLWELLPQVYRSGDTQQLPDDARVPGVLETSGRAGQLRRFVDMFGIGFDALRNSAEALEQIRDIDQAPPQFLELLGKGIGWLPSDAVTLPRRRNEVRNATRLYEVNGTPQSIGALVTQQTGWRSQVAELAESVTRANVAPRRSVYLQTEVTPPAGLPQWRGGLDSAAIFQFPSGLATGAGNNPASMDSAATEPFALFPGAELTIAIDGNVPVRIQFAKSDFADIGSASAAEIASVINRLMGDAEAEDQAGAVRITTLATGPQATLAVLPERQSLLSVSELPQGALAPVSHADGTIDLFFRDQQHPSPEVVQETEDPSRRSNRIFQKSWGHGMWRDAVPLPIWSDDVQDLDAAATADGRSLVLWSTGRQMKFSQGSAGALLPASIISRLSEPFQLNAASQLTVETQLGPEVLTVNPADYADVTNASALEVATAMNAQLANVSAQALPDGSLRLTTVSSGTLANLRIDLAQSTAARALGLSARELLGRGHWSPAREWTPPNHGPKCWGEIADPSVLARPGNGALAAWAENVDSAWLVRYANCSERVLAATALGVAERADAGAPWTVTQIADGLPSDNVRMTLKDADGSQWFATDAGLARRRADGVFQTFTTVDGLASDNIRAIALAPSGAIVCATPLGLTEFTPGSATTTSVSPQAMVSGDLHTVAADGAGAIWVGSSVGIGRRDPAGNWQWWDDSAGVPLGPVVSLAISSKRRPAAAIGSMIIVLEGESWADTAGANAPLPGAVRDIAYNPDGVLNAAMSGGLGRLVNGRWAIETTFTGLPTSDLHSIAWTSTGSLLLGTSSGLIEAQEGGGWSVFGPGDGLPASPALRIAAGWSAGVTLASSPGGDREPHLMDDASGDTWLFWSRRTNASPALSDDWELRLSRFEVVGGWTPPSVITSAPPGGARDRQPHALPDPGGGARLTFATDRNGSSAAAFVPVDAAGVPGPIALSSPSTDRLSNPALMRGPSGETWLFQRSDEALVPSQLAINHHDEHSPTPSALVPGAATIRQQAGSVTPHMSHAARHGLRGRFGDPQSYTEMEPDRLFEDPAKPVPFYTKRTIAVYMRQSPFGKSVTQEEIGRLMQLLNRFKPINLRIALIIAPESTVEYVYPPDADIQESWIDNVPLAENFGEIIDTTSVAIPGLAVLLANELASRSADALDPATLLRRTWFPDLQ